MCVYTLPRFLLPSEQDSQGPKARRNQRRLTSKQKFHGKKNILIGIYLGTYTIKEEGADGVAQGKVLSSLPLALAASLGSPPPAAAPPPVAVAAPATVLVHGLM